MKVLQVLPSVASESGGPVRSTLANCRALHASDPSIRTTLATTDEGLIEPWEASFRARLPKGMDLKIFRATGRGAFKISTDLFAWLRTGASDFDLWVIRALFNPITTTAAWAARRWSVPYLLVPHGTLSRYTFRHRRSLLKRAYFDLLESRTVRGASAIRFTSDRERYEAPLADSGAASAVIPHPFESSPPDEPEADPSEAIACQVLFLSRLHPVKRPELLLAAFQRVRSELRDATLVMAGSGEASHERALRGQVGRLGLSNCVTLPGFVTGREKRRLLRESSVFVLPSIHENYGISVVEAMDAGLPVIISRGVQIWPEIESAGAGITLEKCTPEILAQSIVRLLKDQTRRQAMGRAGQRLVRTAFDPGRVGHEISRLYRAAAMGPQQVREAFG